MESKFSDFISGDSSKQLQLHGKTTLKMLRDMMADKSCNQHLQINIPGKGLLSLCSNALSLYESKLVSDIFTSFHNLTIHFDENGPEVSFWYKMTDSRQLVKLHKHDTIFTLKLMILEAEKVSPEHHLTLTKDGDLNDLFDSSTLEDAGITDFCTVNVSILLKGGARQGFSMVDVFNNNALRNGNFVYHDIPWRTLNPGFGITGLCKNSACVACNRYVVSNNHFGDFEISTLRKSCPMCNNKIKLSNLYFSNCFYSIRGVPVDGSEESFIPWRKVEYGYQTWDPATAGTKNWLRVDVKTRKLDLGVMVPDNKEVKEAPVADNCKICSKCMRKHQTITMLPCSHSFHDHCYDQWESNGYSTEASAACPECNGSV